MCSALQRPVVGGYPAAAALFRYLVLPVRTNAGWFETITHALNLNTLVKNHGHVNVKPSLLKFIYSERATKF